MSNFSDGFVVGAVVVSLAMMLRDWLLKRLDAKMDKDFADTQALFADAMKAHEQGDMNEWKRLTEEFKTATDKWKKTHRPSP